MSHTARVLLWIACALFTLRPPVGLGAELPSSVGATMGSASSMPAKLQVIRQMRERVDHSRFDLDALLESLDYEAGTIIDFVQHEIAFQQYPGVLRGARGALMSRAGNALDQSLLLAKLLKDAGYDARIVRGALSENQVSLLLAQLDNAIPARMTDDELAGITELLAKVTPDNVVEAFDAYVRKVGGREPVGPEQLIGPDLRVIDTALADAGIELGAGEASADLRAEARDYFWVEYRDGASSSWLAVHPAFTRTPNELGTIDPLAVYADQIPQELSQSIRVSARVVQSIAGKAVAHEVMSSWQRPVANLYGTSITFSSVPVNMVAEQDADAVAANLEAADAYLPVFNGSLPGGAQVFDLKGRVVPPDAASSPMAAIFRTESNKLLDGVEALDSDDGSDRQPAMVLEALILSVSVLVPGREQSDFELKIYDRAETASEAAARRALATRVTIGVGAGGYPEGFLLDNLLDRVERAWPFLSYLYQSGSGTEAQQRIASAQLAGFPEDWDGFLPLFEAFNEAPLPAATIHYVDRPIIGFHSSTMRSDGTFQSALDIRSNARRILTRDGKGPVLSASSALEAGVWDGYAERVALGGDQVLSTTSYLADVRRADIKTVALSPSSGSRLEGMAIPDSAKMLIDRQLGDGFVAVLPSQSLRDRPGVFAWWRVDPRTGSTLGFLQDGSGGAITILPFATAMTEFIIEQIVSNGMSGLFAYADYRTCTVHGGDETCCRDRAAMGFIVGGVLGFAASGASYAYKWTFQKFVAITFAINVFVAGYSEFALPEEVTSCR